MPTPPLLTASACRVGVRQGGNLALRGIDVDQTARRLDVDGSWCQPRGHNGKEPYRKPTRTDTTRRAPFPRSLTPALAARLDELRASEDGLAGWLVPDTRTGMPRNNETLDDECHRIRRLTAEHPDLHEAWPKSIPFRNGRHYCATRWHREGMDREDVAASLEHSHQTCTDYDVRKGR